MKSSCKTCKFVECKSIRKSFQMIVLHYNCKKGNKIENLDRGCQDWEKRKI